MNSKGSASGVKAEAKRALRVGVVGAGVMGSNHARVLAGLPDTTLVGVVDPLPAHRTRTTELTASRPFATLDERTSERIHPRPAPPPPTPPPLCPLVSFP